MKTMYMSHFNWWNVSLFAILASPIFFFGLEFFLLIQTFLFDHIQLGMKNIFSDYLNNLSLQILYCSLMSIILMQFISVNLELWV